MKSIYLPILGLFYGVLNGKHILVCVRLKNTQTQTDWIKTYCPANSPPFEINFTLELFMYNL